MNACKSNFYTYISSIWHLHECGHANLASYSFFFYWLHITRYRHIGCQCFCVAVTHWPFMHHFARTFIFLPKVTNAALVISALTASLHYICLAGVHSSSTIWCPIKRSVIHQQRHLSDREWWHSRAPPQLWVNQEKCLRILSSTPASKVCGITHLAAK